jgi:hypothetical protein
VIEGLSALGLLTVRGGSRSVPRKNVRMVAGQPLIGWTIARRSSRACSIAIHEHWIDIGRPADLERARLVFDRKADS